MKRFRILALAIAVCASQPPRDSGAGEAVLEKEGTPIRVRFTGDESAGYEAVFEHRAGDAWRPGAAFADGQAWNVYTDWRDSWYAAPQHVKIQEVRVLTGGRVRASAATEVAGHRWCFADTYSLEHGMVRIDRSFAHTGLGTQSKITLETRLRMPVGSEQRMLMPGVLYNNNPGSTLVGTKISTAPGGLGLFEEHRLPIPMVNIESAVDDGRLSGSLVTRPSKILQGHKGADHWWSLGLEYGSGYVDLLSVSGPLATNGKKSQVYGHRHGFDPYDDAYLDVQGPLVFEKTLYVDLGGGVKTGYGFRETLWKTFEVFRPTETPHLPFPETMMLAAQHAKSLFYLPPAWKVDRAAAVVRFGKVQIADGDALVIGRSGGKKNTYKFYATGKKDPYSVATDPNHRIIGIEIVEPDAWFTKTVDRVIEAINGNADSPVVAESPKFLAFSGESWGMRLVAKEPGSEGCTIELSDPSGKLEFTSNLAGPWGLMGAEPRTTHLVLHGETRAPLLAEKRPAGYLQWPNGANFQYGWCGGNLAIAYGMLTCAEHADDRTARQQAIDAVQFFVRNAQAEIEGLYYGDYDVNSGRWAPGSFDQSASGISSRQYGENLEHLASLVELGWRQRLPEADQWLATLRKAGDFLLRSPRYKGMFPRAWTLKGDALGWPAGGEPAPGTISAAGVQCVTVLGRLAALTGDERYRTAAADAMDAYWREFGQTLATPPWGATLDAGAEDKEAGSGMMRAAMEVYAASQEPRFLEMAKDAADLTLTWMFFHDVGMKPESGLLHEHLHTVGWTFISTQNQEIDVWGYFMAPDYYRLGLATQDERYKQIGRVLFQAASQTISRPGAMFGPVPGIQSEHYNHSNCTYVGGQPGTWRGSEHSMGISWTNAGALYGGTRISELAPEEFSLGPPAKPTSVLRYEVLQKKITVDGDAADWERVKENVVEGTDHLWFGQAMTPDKWHGNQDLSFRWRGAWHGDKLYFLVAVTDDQLIDPPQRPKTWLNDCIEIHLDPQHLRGPRKEVADGKARLRGYELQFLPMNRPIIMLDDLLAPTYPLDSPQNELFHKGWAGEMAIRKTPAGYIAEIGFQVPSVPLQPGVIMGLEVAVTDDDGQSRKALQIWSGNRGEFWLNMDHHPEITLVEHYMNRP